ncbi:MAG: PHP domain-containing protein, partial [Chitinophagaceae bacterium]
MEYTELQITSNFSFLRGGSHPEEMVEQAALMGYRQVAITDYNTLAGVVRAHVAAKKAGIRIIVGCRLELLDGPSLLAFPTDKEAYARLSALLSKGNQRAEKGKCFLYKSDVYHYAEGMKFIAIAPLSLNRDFDFDDGFAAELIQYRDKLGTSLYLGASRSYSANDNKRLYRLGQLSKELRIRMVAVNDVHYHHPARRELQDILTCIREKCTIHTAGFRLHQNAERHLKSMEEMVRLFREYPDAIAATNEIAGSCIFSLDSLEYVYPEEITQDGRSPQEELVKLTWEGANERFNGDIPVHELMKLQKQLAHDDDTSPVHVRQVQNKMTQKQSSHGKLHGHKNSADFDTFGDFSSKPKAQVPDVNQFHSSPGLGKGNDWLNFDDKPAQSNNHQSNNQSSFAPNQQLKANPQVNSQWQNFDFGSNSSSNQQPNNNNNSNNNNN